MTILRTEFTEKIVFLEKPGRETRLALKAAGFRFNGVLWERTRGITSTLSKEQLGVVMGKS